MPDAEVTCQWCGDNHGPTQLCQRAQRGMTRRSFCVLFGAGVGALALGVGPSEPSFRSLICDYQSQSEFIIVSEELMRDSTVSLEELIGYQLALCEGRSL